MILTPVVGFDIPENDLMRRIEELGHASVVEYQRWHGLKPDGNLGPKTAFHMTQRRCALPDVIPMEAEAKACGWNFKEVTISQRVKLVQVNEKEVVAAWNEACGRWNRACGITLRQINDHSESNIYSNSGLIDGGGGVLAWSYLPCDSGPDERMEQLYDDRESWDYDMLLEVATHEIGHAIGIPHLPVGNIMTAHTMGYTKLGPQDVEEAQARYGINTDPTPPQPPPDDDHAKLTGTIGGEPWAFFGFPLE